MHTHTVGLSLEERVSRLEKKIALLTEPTEMERVSYIKEMARQEALGNRACLKEHNRRFKEGRNV